MSNLKQIKQRMRAAKETATVTSTVEMVAAAKFVKARGVADASRKNLQVASQFTALLLQDVDDINALLHKSLILVSELKLEESNVQPNAKNLFIVAIGCNRGLCSNLNSSVAKAVASHAKQHSKEFQNEGDLTINIYCIGAKIEPLIKANAYRGANINFIDGKHFYNEKMTSGDMELMVKDLAKHFVLTGANDIRIAYHFAKNAASHEVKFQSVVTSIEEEILAEDSTSNVAPLIDGDLKSIQNTVIKCYFVAFLNFAIRHHMSAEYALRMSSMNAATKNGLELLEKLSLHYNKMRQNNITKELIDIVGGVSATQDA